MMELSRRGLLRGTLAGGALCLGVSWGGIAGCGGAQKRRIRHAERTGELDANLYIAVLPTGRIRLAVNKAEIGQGVTTGYATLVAEELEVEVDAIDFFFADSLPEYRTSGLEGVPMFRLHATGGSTSMHEAFVPLRRAAAAVREMLLLAAAEQWGIPRGECRAAAGHVHGSGGRKLGYGELTVRAARQAVPDDPPIKRPDQFRVIGKRTRRVDSRAKVTGTAIFGIDVRVPNMARAVIIHGPVYGAEPESLRADGAKAMPGVVDVFATRWGVAVVADKYWQARAAARRVEIEWSPGTAAGLDTAALARAARNYRDAGALVTRQGDVEVVLEAENDPVEAVYEAPHLAHAALEPQNCTVEVRAGRVEVWAPCQVPTVIQEAVADAIGVAADDVLVHTTYCGGGFGRRLLGDVAAQAAVIAKRVRRPVQLIWSRESDTTQGFYRPAATAFLRGAVEDGRAKAVHYHSLSQPISLHQEESTRGGQPTWLPRFARQLAAKSMAALFAANTSIDWFATEGASDTPYRVPHRRFEYTPITTEMPVGFWRSVGHSFNGFFMEGFVDELAHAAGRDPYQFRRQLLAADSRERRVLDAVAQLSAWGGAGDKPGFARGIARHTAFGTEVAQVAEVGIVDGRLRVSPGVVCSRLRYRGQSRRGGGADGRGHHLRSVRRPRSGDHVGRRRGAAGATTTPFPPCACSSAPKLWSRCCPAAPTPPAWASRACHRSHRRWPTRCSPPPACDCGGCRCNRRGTSGGKAVLREATPPRGTVGPGAGDGRRWDRHGWRSANGWPCGSGATACGRATLAPGDRRGPAGVCRRGPRAAVARAVATAIPGATSPCRPTPEGRTG